MIGEHDRSILHILLEAPAKHKCKKDKFEECLNAILDCENGKFVK